GASLGRLFSAVSLDEVDDGPLDEPGDPDGEWPEPLSTAEHAVTTRTSRVPAAPRRALRIGTAQLSQLDLRGWIANRVRGRPPSVLALQAGLELEHDALPVGRVDRILQIGLLGIELTEVDQFAEQFGAARGHRYEVVARVERRSEDLVVRLVGKLRPPLQTRQFVLLGRAAIPRQAGDIGTPRWCRRNRGTAPRARPARRCRSRLPPE